MSAEQKPFTFLQEIAERSIANAAGLPAQVEAIEIWSGVGFMLNGHRMVSPMMEVAELLTPPSSITKLPGVKPWVRGVANLRGRLLPLVDLESFFGNTPVKNLRRRILSVEQSDLYSGLVVSEVFGMQHFPADTHVDRLDKVADNIAPFVTGAYEYQGVTWNVFSLSLLARDSRFLDAAV
jgi:twitching motility protein PilI